MTRFQDEQLEQSVRDMIVVCHHLYSQGLLAACDGNVSMRIGTESLLITPAGKHKGFLESEMLAIVNLKGETILGTPSTELAMHLAVYRNCPSARAVVHAHPPATTAWTIAHPYLKELPCESLSELILAVGKVPVIPYRLPGSVELGDVLEPFITTSKVNILSRHGCLCWGNSIQEAFWGVERLEHAAKTLLYAQMLGGIKPLPKTDLHALHELRTRIGDRIL